LVRGSVDAAPTAGGWGRALAAAVLVASSGVLPVMLCGSLAAQLKTDLAMTETRFGLSLSVYYVLFAAGAIAAGRLVDRVGWKRGIQSAAAASSVALVGIAVGASSFATLLPFMVIAGASQALAAPASNIALLNELPSNRHGVMFGIKQASIPISTIFAGLSVPAIALTAGWRWAFVVAAAFPLAALVMVPRGGTPLRRTGDPRVPRASVLRLPLVVASVAVGFGAIANVALTAFFVSSSVDQGMPVSTAGVVLAVASSLGLGTRIVSGWWVDYRSAPGIRSTAWLSVVGMMGFLTLGLGGRALIPVGAVLAFGGGWGWSGLFHHGIVAAHAHAPAAATGVTQLGFATGASIGPVAFGAIVSATGYRTAWIVGAAIQATAATLFLWASVLFSRRPSAC
jgi:predicted MFS family arabinose efflux permease